MINQDNSSKEYKRLEKQEMQRKKKYLIPFLLVGIAIVLIGTLITCSCLGVFDGLFAKSDSSTEVTKPSTEVTEPSTEATEPSTEATEPSTEATEPSTEATEPSTEATEPSPPYNPDAEPITLTVWVPPMYTRDDTWLSNRLAAFQAANPEYKITWVVTACETFNAAKLVASNPDQAADVFVYSYDQKNVIREVGALHKLDGVTGDFVKNNFCDTLVNTASYSDGSIYGIPFSSSCPVMFYNKDIFSTKDTKSLERMLDKGTIHFPINQGYFNSMFFLANGCTLYGDGYDTSAGIQFGGQKGYDAAQALYSFLNDSNFIVDTTGMAYQRMQKGEIGAYFGLAADYDDLYDALGTKLGVAPLTTVTIAGQQVPLRTFVDSYLLGVNRYSQNPNLSSKLAEFLASEESQLLRYQMLGVTPTIESLSNHSEIKADKLASAEMTVINNYSVMIPPISAMDNFWRPMSLFGEIIVVADSSELEKALAALNEQLNAYN